MKKVLAIILCFCVISSTIAIGGVTAAASTSGVFEYSFLADGTIEITGYNSDASQTPTDLDGQLAIPSEIDGYTVSAIGDRAFNGEGGIESITVPDSVTKIGEAAFMGCSNLTSLTLGSGVQSIGADILQATALYENYNWQDGVLYIGDYLISGKYEIWNDESFEYEISSSVQGNYTIKTGTKVIAADAFNGVTALTGISIPESVIGIGERAFDGTGFYTDTTNWNGGMLWVDNCFLAISDEAIAQDSEGIFYVPDSTRLIADRAFYECTSLKIVFIPPTVKVIGNNAFEGCTALRYIGQDTDMYPEENTEYSFEGGALFNYDKTELICYPVGNERTTYTVPDTVETIADNAFYGAKKLESINLSNVTGIGKSAFYGCTKLTSVIIPDSVEYLANSAFRNCSELESVTLSSNLEVISRNAFYNCGKLQGITIPASVTGIEAGAFSECTSLETISVDSENTVYSSVDNVLFNDDKAELVLYSAKNSYESYTIPDGIETICESAFATNSSLKSVVIPDSVVTIGNSAFFRCQALNTVDFGDGIETIGGSAFRMTAVKTVTLGNSVKTIGARAFSDNTDLESVTVGNGLKTIKSYAFMSCSALNSVTLGESVEEIGLFAFMYCPLLTSITIPASVTTIDDKALGYIDNGGSELVVIDGFTISGYTGTEAETYADNNGINFVSLDNNDDLADYRYTIRLDGTVEITDYIGSATDLVVPSTIEGYPVTTIGNNAFAYLSDTVSVTLPDSVTVIGKYAFNRSTNLASITLGDNIERIGYNSFAYTAFYNDENNWEDGALYIGDYLIAGCRRENNVTVSSVQGDYAIKPGTKVIAANAFNGVTALTGISIPNSVIGIGENAFRGTGFYKDTTNWIDDALYADGCLLYGFNYDDIKASGDYSVVDGTRLIADSAFYECYFLTGVTIPASVEIIGYNAFDLCYNLEYIAVAEANTIYISFDGVLYDRKAPVLIKYPAAREGTAYTMLQGVETVADYAFSYISKLQSVNIPSTVNLISEFAFYESTSLQAFVVDSSNSVYASEDGVLFNADKTELIAYPLGKQDTSYTVPDSVVTVCEDAFSQNIIIQSVTFGDNLETIESGAFLYCTALNSVNLGNSVKTIETYAFDSCNSLSSVTIPRSVTSLGNASFGYYEQGHMAIYGFTISGYIGTEAETYADNNGINFVSLDNNDDPTEDDPTEDDLADYEYTIRSDGTVEILRYTGSAAELVVPSTIEGYPVTTIDNSAFADLTSLVSVTLPDSVTVIEESAFYLSTNLASITLGDNIERIGYDSFGNTAFYNDENNWEDGALYIGDYLIAGCRRENNVTVSSVQGDYTIKDGTKVIAANAFNGATALTGISIPNSVIGIGKYAFYNTGIYKDTTNWIDGALYIDNCLILGRSESSGVANDYSLVDGTRLIADSAFYECYTLSSISIPASVKIIGNDIFELCYNLEYIAVAEANAYYMSDDGVLYDKTAPVLIKYPPVREGTDYTILPGVEIIEDAAFLDVINLQSVTIPASVYVIKQYSFGSASNQSCSLQAFVVDSENTTYASEDGVLFNADKTELIAYPQSKQDTSYTVPDSVVTVCEGAFFCNTILQSVTFGNNLETIEGRAFMFCTALNSVDLGNSVTTIEGFTFDSTGLSGVTIPASVTTIGYRALGYYYAGNMAVTGFTITGYDGTEAENYATSNGFTFVSLGDAPVVEDDPDDYGYIVNLDGTVEITDYIGSSTELVIPSTIEGCPVTTISDFAFAHLSEIVSITVPDSVTVIGRSAFSVCDSLTSLTLGDNIERIGEDILSDTALYNDDSNWEDSVLYIGDYLISGKYEIWNEETYTYEIVSTVQGDYTIKNGTKVIAEYAFTGITALTGITIPESVIGIGNGAFDDTAFFKDTTNWIDGALYVDDCLISGTKSGNIEVSGDYSVVDGTRLIADYAFYECYTLSSISIPESVEVIGYDTFYSCMALANIEVAELNANYFAIDGVLYNKNTPVLIKYPAAREGTAYTMLPGVETVADYAFSYISKLQSVNIPSTVNSIKKRAFNSSNSLQAFVVNSNNTVYASEDGVLFNADKTELIAYPQSKQDTSYTVPDSVVTVCEDAFSQNIIIQSVTFGDNLETIESGAFMFCTALNNVNLGNSVTTIEAFAFDTCENLKNITIPRNVTSLGYGAFGYCYAGYMKVEGFTISGYTGTEAETYATDNSFTFVSLDVTDPYTEGVYEYQVLADGTVEITDYDAAALSALENFNGHLNIPPTIDGHTVTKIDDCAFMECTDITKLTVPDTVTFIGAVAFGRCTNLASITLGSCIESINTNTFYGTAFYNDESNWDNGALYIADCFIAGARLDGNLEPVSALEGDYEIKAGTRVIAAEVFFGCENLTGLSIPESVMSIGRKALDGTALYDESSNWVDSELYIDNCLIISKAQGDFAVADGTRVIAAEAMYSTYITSLSIPASVKNIGISALNNCHNLTNIEVAEANTEYLSENGVLFNKDKTKLILYPIAKEGTSYTVPNGVEIICESAFNCNDCLEEITLPESLKAIDKFAFADSDALRSITIPSGVTFIGERAFAQISTLSSIDVDSENTAFSSIDGVLFNKAATELIAYPQNKGTTYTVPDGVETIAQDAFYRNNTLQSVTISDSVVTIGETSFYFCESLSNVVLGNSVKTIEDQAFGACNALRSITIPSSVKSIARRAIGYNFSSTISGFVISGYNGTEAEKYATDNGITFNSLGEVPSSDPYTEGVYEYALLADGTVEITDYDAAALSALENFNGHLNIPPTIDGYTVTKIDNWAFRNCTDITKLTVPDTVTYIGAVAFGNCTNLVSITLGSGIELIYSSTFLNTAFYNNADNWDNGALYIADCFIAGAILDANFDPVSALEGDYEIKAGTRVIARYAFENCPDLTGLSIPESVMSIGARALDGTALYDDLANWVDGTLYIDNYLIYSEAQGDFAVPDGTRVIAEEGLDGSYITSLSIPASVKNIGISALNNCHNLTNIEVAEANTEYLSENGVLFNKDKTKLIQYPIAKEGTSYTVPNGVEIICESAFNCNKYLTGVTLPESLKAIDKFAFADSDALRSITIPSGVTFIGERAFAQISTLSSIDVDSENTAFSSIDGVLFNKAATELIAYPQNKGTTYTVPDGVETIAQDAFYRNNTLQSVTISDSVVTIGETSFYFCESLSNVVLGNSVKTIEDEAFGICNALRSITIPSSVKSIGSRAIGYYFFNTISGFVISGYNGTEAEKYATDNNITFNSLGDAPSVDPLAVDVSMVEGAAMRFNTVTGMRFYTKVDTEKIAELKAAGAEVKMGTLIAAENLLGGEELTFDAPSGSFRDVKFTSSTYFTQGDFTGIVGSLATIKTHNVNRKFVARGYVKVTLNGKTTISYASYVDNDASKNTRTIAWIATQVKNSTEYSTLTDAQKEIVDNYSNLYVA